MTTDDPDDHDDHGAGNALGIGLSDAVVLFHDALGSLMGLTAADHKAIGILRREGPMSASRLAARTGRTPGAVTGLIDRLEAAGLAGRERDTQDRRRLVVAAIAPTSPAVTAALEGLAAAMGRVTAQFTREELLVVARWVTLTTDALRGQVDEIARRRDT